MFNRIFRVAIILMIFSPSFTQAGVWTDFQTVKVVSLTPSGSILISLDASRNHINPDGCEKTGWLAIQSNNPIYDQIYKMVLTSQAAKMPLRVELEGCSGPYPNVKATQNRYQ